MKKSQPWNWLEVTIRDAQGERGVKPLTRFRLEALTNIPGVKADIGGVQHRVHANIIRSALKAYARRRG